MSNTSNNTGTVPLNPADWVSRYGDYLFSIAMLKTSNRETAEDLVQETFIAAIKAKDTFREASSEKTWLTAILKNKIIDHYRKKDVLKNVSTYLDETDASFADNFFHRNGHWKTGAMPHNWQENADGDINRAEFYRILQECIQKMPAKLVPVFTARFIDNEDSDIICKEFNITSSNYWVIIHRAKVLMRNCLEKNWFVS